MKQQPERDWGDLLRRSCDDDEVEGGERNAVDSVIETNKSASKLEQKGQERVIEHLANENELLKRRVAGFQLALQLSADEDIASPSPVFSAMPPAFPLGGGLPDPSPRVTRGGIRKDPPVRQSSPTNIGESDAYLVHQLKVSDRRVRVLEKANQTLTARVEKHEDRTVRNHSTQSRLTEQKEEIASLRKELEVMRRLARAQDRKFEGSEGYAMARRLWVVEKELRLAKAAAASSVVELTCLWKSQSIRNRVHGRRHSDDTSAGESHLSPHRPAVPRRQSPAKARRTILRTETFGGMPGGEKGVVSRGARSVRRVNALHEKDKGERDALEARIRSLERALANMRSKAHGELRAARVENGRLKKETCALSRDLAGKTKDVEMQFQQVNRLKRQLRHLSDGATKLEMVAAVAKVYHLAATDVAAAGEHRPGLNIDSRRPSPRLLGTIDHGQTRRLERRQEVPAPIKSSPANSSTRHSCSLSGILDTSELPPRTHHRSFNSDDRNMATDPLWEGKSEDCIVVSDGSVRHGQACVLKSIVQVCPVKVKPVEDLAAGGWSGCASENGPLSIRKWSNIDLPAADAAALALGERRLSFGSRQHSNWNSCLILSGDGRFKPKRCKSCGDLLISLFNLSQKVRGPTAPQTG